jgi:hypothetical protein
VALAMLMAATETLLRVNDPGAAGEPSAVH